MGNGVALATAANIETDEAATKTAFTQAKQRRLRGPEPLEVVGSRAGAAEKEIGRSVIAIAVLALPFGNTCLDSNPAGDDVGHGCLHSLHCSAAYKAHPLG
jgi:hypothetical protein